jgi:hypothetical protein
VTWTSILALMLTYHNSNGHDNVSIARCWYFGSCYHCSDRSNFGRGYCGNHPCCYCASFPAAYWAEALRTTTYLLNLRSTKALSFNTPHFALFDIHLNLSHLRVFGCKCYPNRAATTTHKLVPRSTVCLPWLSTGAQGPPLFGLSV